MGVECLFGVAARAQLLRSKEAGVGGELDSALGGAELLREVLGGGHETIWARRGSLSWPPRLQIAPTGVADGRVSRRQWVRKTSGP